MGGTVLHAVDLGRSVSGVEEILTKHNERRVILPWLYAELLSFLSLLLKGCHERLVAPNLLLQTTVFLRGLSLLHPHHGRSHVMEGVEIVWGVI